jgi:DNA-binding GntR family transcriptional regulator
MDVQNIPIISRTVRTALAENLRDAILLGEYVPGQNLRLEEIAKRFDVSTTPVREALSDLADEGLVTIFPHRGANVTRLSPEELQEIYEIRATWRGARCSMHNDVILTSLYSPAPNG